MTRSRLILFSSVFGLISLSLIAYPVWLRATEDRSLFVELQRGNFHPSFFWEYERAVRQDAAWTKDPHAVAVGYAGATGLCPDSQFTQLSGSADHAVFIIVNQCWAGIFAAKKWRVDLALMDGHWQIEWSGVTYKCSRKIADPGTLLVTHNPLRLIRAPWVVGLNRAVQLAGYHLNPWQTTCSP